MKTIKLKFIGLCLTLFLALPCQAQLGEERHNLAVGVNGGINMSQVDFMPKIKQSSHNGMSLGVTARYMCEKYFVWNTSRNQLFSTWLDRKDRRRFRKFIRPNDELFRNPSFGTFGIRQRCFG